MPNLLRSSIERSVQELREKAFVAYGVDINPAVAFSVKGMTAAYAVFDTQVLDFNLQLAIRYREVFATDIVGHEFIHLLANEVHNHQGHATPWKEMMKEFSFSPEVTYKLDVSGLAGVERKEKIYLYKCSCQTRFISREQHLNIKRKISQCPECKSVAKCINDRAHTMRTIQPGTRASDVAELLVSYATQNISQEESIRLLGKEMNLTYNSARSYFYKYRPL